MELNIVLIISLAQAFKGLLDVAKVEFNEENVVKILASVDSMRPLQFHWNKPLTL